MMLDGTPFEVQNSGTQSFSTTVDGSFAYQFKFFSANADYLKHMGVINAIATCKATPKPCVMHSWGDDGGWGACSVECDVNKQGGGLQSRPRDVKTPAQYG